MVSSWGALDPVSLEAKYLISADELGALTAQPATSVLAALDDGQMLRLPGGRTGIRPEAVRTTLDARGFDYAFRVIAHVNLKGGTGKTTTTITAASRAVQYGFNTCIIDMDSQASASLAFDALPQGEDMIFSDVWQQPERRVAAALKPLAEGLYLLPSSLENSLLDIQLSKPSVQKLAVRGVCQALKREGFDLVMIDCPPSLGTAVISSICAADTIVIPATSDAFSLKGVELTRLEIAAMCETFGIPGPRVLILHTQFDKRLGIAHEARGYLTHTYPEHFIPVPIRTSSEYAKVLKSGATVFSSHCWSVARKDYDEYVRYLLGWDRIQARDRSTEA